MCVFSPLPALAFLPENGAVLGQEELARALSMGQTMGCGGLAGSPFAACVSPSSGCPCPAQTLLCIWGASLCHSLTLTLAVAALAPVWIYMVKQAGLEQSLGSSWGMCGGSCEKLTSHSWSLNLPSLLCAGTKQASIWALLTSRVQAFYNLPVSATGSASSQVGSSSLWWPHGWGTQYMTWTAHSPGSISTHIISLSSEFLHRGTGPDLTASPPRLPDSMWIFLTALVVQESCCQSPVSFQWELFQV